MAFPEICCHQLPVSTSRIRKFWLLIPASRKLDGGRRRMIQAGGLSPPLKRRPPTLVIAVQLRSGYELALRFSIRLSITLGSASVEVSPRLPNSLSAILRKMRRMIFPERVFGRLGAN